MSKRSVLISVLAVGGQAFGQTPVVDSVYLTSGAAVADCEECGLRSTTCCGSFKTRHICDCRVPF